MHPYLTPSQRLKQELYYARKLLKNALKRHSHKKSLQLYALIDRLWTKIHRQGTKNSKTPRDDGV